MKWDGEFASAEITRVGITTVKDSSDLIRDTGFNRIKLENVMSDQTFIH